MTNQDEKPNKESGRKENEKQAGKADKSLQKINNRLTAMCGVLMALAMILSYLESLVPLSFAVPGIKLGLANMVTIIALQKLGAKPAVIISAGRIILSGILFGNLAVILYSLAGAALSLAVMCIAGKIKLFTVTGISVCGAVAHNMGQLLMAACVTENAAVLYYMAVLVVSGTIAGVVVGILAGAVMKNIHFRI